MLSHLLQEKGLVGHGRQPWAGAGSQVIRGGQPWVRPAPPTTWESPALPKQPPWQEVKTCDPEDWVTGYSWGVGSLPALQEGGGVCSPLLSRAKPSQPCKEQSRLATPSPGRIHPHRAQRRGWGA